MSKIDEKKPMIVSDAIINGVMLSGANFCVSVVVATLAYRRVFKNFNNTVLLSMLVRYLVVASIVWYKLTVYSKPEAMEFGLAFMISTFIFIISEIIVFHFSSNLLNLQNIDKS